MPAIAFLCLSLSLGSEGPALDWNVLVRRLEETDVRNADALLKLGTICEESRHLALAVRAYEKLARLEGEGVRDTDRCEASFRLARMELAAGKSERAVPRLREISRQCPGHEEARALLRTVESTRTREQAKLVEEAQAAFDRGDWTRALDSFEKAYKLYPDASPTEVYVPRRVLLERIAQCRNRLDEVRYEREYKPLDRSITPCPACGKSEKRGFIVCGTCGGKGKVESPTVIPNVRGGLRPARAVETCRTCNGRGYQGCGNCFALGWVSKEITVKEKRALRSVALSVSEPKLLTQPLDLATKAVEEALLGVEDAAALNFLRAVKPDYALSGELRKSIPRVPIGLAGLPEASLETWKKDATSAPMKLNFLLNYACEFSGYLKHFDTIRSAAKPDLRCLTNAAAWSDEVSSPEILAAFPGAGKLQCTAVRGIFRGYRDAPAGEHKGLITLEGEIPHDVVFFVWLPSAREHLEWLGKGPWKKAVEGLSAGYPFLLSERVGLLPRDHYVTVIGRFLRNDLGYPRNWFEVWRYELGLGTLEEEALRRLSEPVDLAFPGNSLKQVIQVLADWFDLNLRLEGISDTIRVRCEAREAPAGLLVDVLAKEALSAAWRWEGGSVVISVHRADPKNAPSAAVLRALEALRGPGTRVEASLVHETEASVAEAEMPPDPAGLRVAARRSLDRMHYREALVAYERQRLLSKDPRKSAALDRVLRKLRLLDRLTARTPVSRLVDAPELAEIVYQKPSGDLVQAVVSLRREGETWTVQEAYGASFRIQPDLIKRLNEVPLDAWRSRKESELIARAATADEAKGEDRATKLFLLALFSKTHGFAARGATFLDRAVELPQFAEVLRRFFPLEAGELIALWRDAGTVPGPLLEAAGASSETEVLPISIPAIQGLPIPIPLPMPAIGNAKTPIETETPGERDPALDEAVEPLPEGLGPADLLAFAVKQAKAGSACTRRVLEGTDAALWRKKALEHLAVAEKAVGKLLEATPEDAAARRLASDIAALSATCKKDLGFFE